MRDFDYCQPATVPALLTMMQGPAGTILAGGTDLVPGIRRGRRSPERIFDISRITDLRYITQTGTHIRIGALTTHADLAGSDLLQEVAPGLVHAAETIGSRQTRERGTLGGNLANASPAADLAPILLALDTQIILTDLHGNRLIPLNNFFVPPGKTCLAANEIISGVQFVLPGRYGGMDYLKLGKRNGMAIAVASAAVYLELDSQGMIRLIRIGMGSVAPRPIRCFKLEELLTGQHPDPEYFREAVKSIPEDISPITDIRASGEYRMRVSQVLLERALHNAYQQAQEKIHE